MSFRLVRLRPETYEDSVQLMKATRAMQGQPGVDWAAALMGTPANVEVLAGEAFDDPALATAGANDLVLAVRAASREVADKAMSAGDGALSASAPSAARAAERRPRSLEEAGAQLPGANVALVSVPGAYASLEAHKALSAGLHVLLFSDNVPLADEVELKSRAAGRGLLLMGPGAGTALLGGIGLGFANAVRRGSLGVVAAAGTGAQEVTTLVDRWGAGIRHAIGIGGRDLSEAVGGRMARVALRALCEDPQVEAVLLVSKPPSPAVAASLLEELGGKPTVAALIGLEEEITVPQGVRVARTLEEAASLSIEALGLFHPDPAEGLREVVARAATGLAPGRSAIRGLFSGGTLCYESMAVLAPRLGPVHSNVPLRGRWSLPAPAGAHVCLDLGEEEYTRGRPHPMIDPEARSEMILKQAADQDTAVILIDVVLGFGAHPDPASVLAPVCTEVGSRPDGPVVVAYVLGTEADPQDLSGQRRRLEEAGCLLAPTGARSALMAAAIASRNPGLAEEERP
ncbi:MAG: protein FdrA [Actinomycetota bacterium]